MDIGGVSPTGLASRPATTAPQKAAPQTTPSGAETAKEAGTAKKDAFGPAVTTTLSTKTMSIDLSSLANTPASPEAMRLKTEFEQAEIFKTWHAAYSDYQSKQNDLAKSVLGLGDNDFIMMDGGGAAVLDRLSAAHGLTAPAFPDALKGTRFDNDLFDPDLRSKTKGTIGVTFGEPGKGAPRTIATGKHFEIQFDPRTAATAGDNGLVAIDGKNGGTATASLFARVLGGNGGNGDDDDDGRYAITTASGGIAATVTAGGIDTGRDSTILDVFKKLKPYLS